MSTDKVVNIAAHNKPEAKGSWSGDFGRGPESLTTAELKARAIEYCADIVWENVHKRKTMSREELSDVASMLYEFLSMLQRSKGKVGSEFFETFIDLIPTMERIEG